MTFLNQIDEQVEEVKRDLAFRLLIAGEEAGLPRKVSQILSFAGVDTQKTDAEVYTPPGKITISPVEYQEP